MSKWQICFGMIFFVFASCNSEEEMVRPAGGIIPRAIVVGATSGMGRQVAKVLANEKGYTVGLVGRRTHLLDSLQDEIETKSYAKSFDVSEHESASEKLTELIEEVGGLDLLFISISGTNDIFNESDVWVQEKKWLDVDLIGFWVMARTALDYFEQQGYGHLAAISSISGVYGAGCAPCYSASKAFVSTYLEGIKNQMVARDVPIVTTDVVAGYVANESFTPSNEQKFYWVSDVVDAAKQICEALENKQDVVYVSKNWELIASLLKQNSGNIRHGLSSVMQLRDFVV